jgi:hypothetical protein
MASCFLFQLPQELRDQIYMYALYNEGGIHYQICSDGIARLCRRPKTLSFHSTIVRWLYRCSLRHGHKKHACENNQLKYVCKQLYSETKELDLLYNFVIFKDTAKKDALEQCTFLFSQCPTLRQVAIKCTLQTFQKNYMKHGFSTIMRHCQIDGNVRAKIYIPYWSQENPNFILTGLYFLSTLRADTRPVTEFAQNILVSYRPNSLQTHGQIPPNIRIYPKEERFCRQTFERNCRKNPFVRLPNVEADLAAVIQYVESWFRYGL